MQCYFLRRTDLLCYFETARMHPRVLELLYVSIPGEQINTRASFPPLQQFPIIAALQPRKKDPGLMEGQYPPPVGDTEAWIFSGITFDSETLPDHKLPVSRSSFVGVCLMHRVMSNSGCSNHLRNYCPIKKRSRLFTTI